MIMTGRLIGALLGVLLLVSASRGQSDLQRGKLKKVDADKRTITITIDGRDRDFLVTDDTHVVGAASERIERPFEDKSLAAGTAVVFKAGEKDGKAVLVGLKVGGPGGTPGGGDIRRAKLKKIDLDKRVLTLTVDGKDRDFLVTDETQVLGGVGKDLKERLQGFKEGADIFFKAGKADGKEAILGLKLADDPGKPGASQLPPPAVDTSKLIPLSELGTREYHGFQGGFYPDGKNQRPEAHEAAGLRLASKVQPLDTDGKPSAGGKIVLLSVGMSNTSQSSVGFERELKGFHDRSTLRNPRLLFVNGAQGGMTAQAIQNPEDGGSGTRYWTEVDRRLKSAGVTRGQVQVIWIKQADAGPSQGFPAYAQKLQAELIRIVQLLPARFPNIKLVYLSSRTYGGYAKTRLNPEPYAYESGFSVKWLIEQQIKGNAELNYDAEKGAIKAPWLSWGPYLWAQGSTKRADGFFYDETDFTANDGTHQSASGQAKVGKLLLEFFKNDTTTRPWFVVRE
jgi:hypothetical protein